MDGSDNSSISISLLGPNLLKMHQSVLSSVAVFSRFKQVFLSIVLQLVLIHSHWLYFMLFYNWRLSFQKRWTDLRKGCVFPSDAFVSSKPVNDVRGFWASDGPWCYLLMFSLGEVSNWNGCSHRISNAHTAASGIIEEHFRFEAVEADASFRLCLQNVSA